MYVKKIEIVNGKTPQNVHIELLTEDVDSVGSHGYHRLKARSINYLKWKIGDQ